MEGACPKIKQVVSKQNWENKMSENSGWVMIVGLLVFASFFTLAFRQCGESRKLDHEKFMKCLEKQTAAECRMAGLGVGVM